MQIVIPMPALRNGRRCGLHSAISNLKSEISNLRSEIYGLESEI